MTEGAADGAPDNWPPFSLLETMLCDPARLSPPAIHLLDQHMDRLHRSAQHFRDVTGGSRFACVPPREELVLAVVEAVERRREPASPQARLKVRLLVDVQGGVQVQITELSCAKRAVKLAFDKEPTPSGSQFVRHKTTNRTLYDEARKRAGCPPLGSPTDDPEADDAPDDVIMYNAQGQVTETSVCNLAVEMPDGRWLTPSVECGLLAGTERAHLLQSGVMDMYEGAISVDGLKAAVKSGFRVRVFNSVRGVSDARVV